MVNEHDLLLPIANVGRIMKQSLPPSAKISKEAKETMQECVSEFVSFVTGEASDKCQKENRKTVNGDDICWALSALGFDDYAVAIARYLHKYREFERERCNQSKASSIEDSTNEAPHSCNTGSKPRKEAESPPAPLEIELIDKKGKNPTTKQS